MAVMTKEEFAQTVKFPSAQLCIYSGYVIKRPEIVKNGRLGEKSGYRGEILLC